MAREEVISAVRETSVVRYCLVQLLDMGSNPISSIAYRDSIAWFSVCMIGILSVKRVCLRQALFAYVKVVHLYSKKGW